MIPRSYLFVPGNRPERFTKAVNSGADAIILDLEDAVAPAAKVHARDAVSAWLKSGHRAYVRINAEGTEWHYADIETLAQLPGLLGLVVPKAERADTLARIANNLPSGVITLPLIESALGFDGLREIAHAPTVQRLLFGTLDFQVDMGIRGDGNELHYFRSQLTLASRVAGLASPVDGVTSAIDDGERIQRDTMHARNLGFRAKLCIHPRQISYVHAALNPTDEELKWAQRVMAAVRTTDGAATAVDGLMVDLPVILRATEILGANPLQP